VCVATARTGSMIATLDLITLFAIARVMAVASAHRSWMLERLEHETRGHHAVAGSDRFRVLDDPTPEGYRRLLPAVFHFGCAVESKLVNVEDLSLAFVASRLRTAALGDDMLALGTEADEMQILVWPIELPGLDRAPEALGWIYVLQRNTLHHAGLYRALAPR